MGKEGVGRQGGRICWGMSSSERTCFENSSVGGGDLFDGFQESTRCRDQLG